MNWFYSFLWSRERNGNIVKEVNEEDMLDEENDEFIFCMVLFEYIKINVLWILFIFWCVKMYYSKMKIEWLES